MSTVSKDARGFIEGVASYLKGEGKAVAASRVEMLLSRVSDQARKEKSAKVETSVSPTREEKVRIEKILAKLLGHRIQVSYAVTPAVIAGLTIRVADWVLDTSFRGQLTLLADALTSE